MKTFPLLKMKSLLGSLFAVLALTCSFAATADPAVVRIVHFTAVSLEQQQAVSKMVGTDINKAYAGAKGLKWVKYLIDAKTLETGSVSLWDSRADLEAFLKSDAYKDIPGKLKPFMKGAMVSKVYDVLEPAK